MTDYTLNWNPELGLWWRDGPGHTPPVANLPRVHPGTTAASRLFHAAAEGNLPAAHPEAVLAAIRRMQVLDLSERHGCIRWYWEEPAPVDTNAAFFTGLPLISLRLAFRPQLGANAESLLHAVLSDLAVWFNHAVSREAFHYPNKYLGDLACAWLLHEALGKGEDTTGLADRSVRAADYWLAHGWGWGEHMSDIYAAVCLNELAATLMLVPRLPPEVERAFRRLLGALLEIEDLFGDGPRVPAVRSYAFDHAPRHANYRWQMDTAPAGRPEFIRPFGPQFTQALAQHGGRPWRDIATPPRAAARGTIEVPCFDGAKAVAYVADDIRLGSLTRFPLMRFADGLTWGLSWQTFPACFWRPEGDWAFLQWAAAEGDRLRAHPALDKHSAYLHNALTTALEPALVGRTWAIQKGPAAVILRVMPQMAQGWTRLADRWRILGCRAEPQVLDPVGAWWQMLLPYPQRTVSLHCLDLGGGPAPHLWRGPDGSVEWSIGYETEALRGRRCAVHLWAVNLEGKVAAAPRAKIAGGLVPIARTLDQRAWEVHWDWPGVTWRVRVDPMADVALVELTD